MSKFKILSLAILLLFNTNYSFSQDEKDSDKEDKKEDNTKTIEDLTKSSIKIEGLFTIFQDTVNGKLKMIVKESQFNKDFIYFSQIADGVLRLEVLEVHTGKT